MNNWRTIFSWETFDSSDFSSWDDSAEEIARAFNDNQEGITVENIWGSVGEDEVDFHVMLSNKDVVSIQSREEEFVLSLNRSPWKRISDHEMSQLGGWDYSTIAKIYFDYKGITY